MTSRAVRLEQPRAGVADRGPPDGPDVHRAGRIRRHELEIELLAGEIVATAVGRSRLDDRPGEHAERPGGQGDVEKARARHVDLGDAVGLAQPGGDRLGDLARRRAGRLGQPQGDIRRVVAVLGIAGALDDHVGGNRPAELARVAARRDRRRTASGQFGRGHRVNRSGGRS